MNYTKSQRKSMVAALRRARAKVESRKHRVFVCEALGDTLGSDMAWEYIIRLLGGFLTLEGWIASHVTGGQAYTDEWISAHRLCLRSPIKMRETRLAWIDHMIATLGQA